MKILFLSLGAGNLFFSQNTQNAQNINKEELLEKMISDGRYAYRTAKYRINGRIYESPFVADALINQYRPDHILVVGTVKSAWSSFFARFFDASDKSRKIMELYNQEQNNGLIESKDSKRLAAFEEKIRSIIPKNLKIHGKTVGLDIKLLAYGIDQEELLFDFRELSKKWMSLLEVSEAKDIDIAFDITHSFRSMPLYNVVILNYLMKTSEKNITLSHVYYGNLDTANENNGIAEVVDLKEIPYFLSLTEGISEFNNSGNSSKIVEEIREVDPVMADKLEAFDWAVQTSRLLSLVDAVKDIKKEIDTRDKSSEFHAVYEMLRLVLVKNFPSDEELTKLDDVDSNITAYAYIQRRIGLWHLRHGRYGQALVTADESLRSYVTALYIKRKRDLTRELLFNYSQRMKALDNVIKEKGREEYSRVRGIYPELSDRLTDVKRVHQSVYDDRNVFAHSLWEAPKNQTNNEIYNYKKVKTDIEQFYWELYKLEHCIEADNQAAIKFVKALCPLSDGIKEKESSPQKSKGKKKRKKLHSTTIHFFTPQSLSKKGGAMLGVLEDGSLAMLKVDIGTKLEDVASMTQVLIVGKAPQGGSLVEKLKYSQKDAGNQ